VDIGCRRAANVHASQDGGHGPGLVIDFCTSPGRTGNSTYRTFESDRAQNSTNKRAGIKCESAELRK